PPLFLGSLTVELRSLSAWLGAGGASRTRRWGAARLPKGRAVGGMFREPAPRPCTRALPGGDAAPRPRPSAPRGTRSGADADRGDDESRSQRGVSEKRFGRRSEISGFESHLTGTQARFSPEAPDRVVRPRAPGCFRRRAPGPRAYPSIGAIPRPPTLVHVRLVRVHARESLRSR